MYNLGVFEFCEREFPDLMISKVEFTSGLDAESNLWPDKLLKSAQLSDSIAQAFIRARSIFKLWWRGETK
jgi:hypothetical protein